MTNTMKVLNGLETCSQAADMLQDDWERLKPKEIKTIFDLYGV